MVMVNKGQLPDGGKEMLLNQVFLLDTGKGTC